MKQYFIYAFLFLIFHLINASQLYDPGCRIDNFDKDEPDKVRIYCYEVGKYNRSLDEYLQAITHVNPMGRNMTYEQIAPEVTELFVDGEGVGWENQDVNGNVVKISDILNQLPNLKSLLFAPWAVKSIDYYYRSWPQLIISPNAFRNNFKLKELIIVHYDLHQDTFQAIEKLKDQLEVLWVGVWTPGNSSMQLLSKMSNLREVIITYCQDEINPFPQTVLQNSAPTLTKIHIKECNIPKITKSMFQGMRNLTDLYLEESNITTIEPNAFDDLINLEQFKIKRNPIKLMPHGLFSKMTKLGKVMLWKNKIDNVSDRNFTRIVQYHQD